MKSLQVSRDQIDGWPLTVDAGELRTDGWQVTFIHGAIEYGVNGIATSRGYPDVEPIWADDPSTGGGKADIGPLIVVALGL